MKNERKAIKSSSKKQVKTSRVKTKRLVDSIEKKHRDMLGLNGESAYAKTYGW